MEIPNGLAQWDVREKLDEPITVDEVVAAIKEAKNNKAPGENGIPVELFETLPQTSSGRLADLFSRIWSTNSIPEDFTKALVIRVISLLSTAAKILAKILPVSYTHLTLPTIYSV